MAPSETMLFYAFRYALGRRTYAVSDVVDELQKQWPTITQRTKCHIHREIADAISTNRAGDDCDIKEWQKVLAL